MLPDPAAPAPRLRRLTLYTLSGLVLALVLTLFFMGSKRDAPPQSDATCAASAQTLARLKPLARGAVAALSVPQTPRAAIPVSFLRADGHKVSLKEFGGKTVLLNLWATWCAPCRHEMPALDALQVSMGSPVFEVVAVAIDQRNLDKPGAFLDEIGVKTLHRYADPSAKIFADLKIHNRAFGMPTTLLIDPQGCELASLAGPADWASAEAKAFIAAALAPQ